MLDSLKETALWSVSTGTLAGLYFGIQTQEYNFPIYKFAHLQIYRFSNCPSLCGLLIYLCTLPYDSSERYNTPAIQCAPLILSADAVLGGRCGSRRHAPQAHFTRTYSTFRLSPNDDASRVVPRIQPRPIGIVSQRCLAAAERPIRFYVFLMALKCCFLALLYYFPLFHYYFDTVALY